MRREASSAATLHAEAAAWALAAQRGEALDVIALGSIGPAWQAVLEAATDDDAMERVAIGLLRRVLPLGRWAGQVAHDSAVPPLAARLLAVTPDPRHGLRLSIEWRLPMDARLSAAMPWARAVEQVLRDAGVAHRFEHVLWPPVGQSDTRTARALWSWGCQSMLPAMDFGVTS